MLNPNLDEIQLNKQEYERYSRHLILPEVGLEGQKRLKAASVLCIGTGGLGSPLLLYLAAAGVGRIGIVDFDIVDHSNLQRQVIHGTSWVGKPKIESAKNRILEINPFCQVDLYETRVSSENAIDIATPYDIIIDGTDNFPTRYLMSDVCVLLNKPNVYGSIFRFEGQETVFNYEGGPNYRDLYPEPPPPGMVPSCAEGGVLGILCASIGSIMSTEAVKLITGIGEPLIGRLMVYDALEMSYTTLKISRDPHGEPITGLLRYDAFCGAGSDGAAEAAAGSTISVTQLASMLKERDEGTRDFTLVDVREPNEYEINRIPGAVLIPKGEFLNGNAFDQLGQDKPVVLHCKSGQRSAAALAAPQRAGHSRHPQ